MLIMLIDSTTMAGTSIPDSVPEIFEGTFLGCDGLKVTYQGQEYTYANDPYFWWGY